MFEKNLIVVKRSSRMFMARPTCTSQLFRCFGSTARMLLLVSGLIFCLLKINNAILEASLSRKEVSVESFDILILGGRVMDGTGNPWIREDIGIREGQIVAIGALEDASAERVIEANNLYVVPGFIDSHSHAAEGLSRDGLQQGQPMLAQGVTTVMINPDGGGVVDLVSQRAELEKNGLGVNVVQLIGHGSVRREVLGMEDRVPTPRELTRMSELVREGMLSGAFGLSSGLFYAPGSYAETEELIVLAKVVSEFGGVHTSHIRDESNYSIGVVKAVQEIIEISETAELPGIVTHMKALGPDSWGKSVASTIEIDEARARGVEIFTDQYPYEASSTSVTGALIPRWAQVGGDAEMKKRIENTVTRTRLLTDVRENIRRRGGPASLQVSRFAPDQDLEGRNLETIAQRWDLSPEEAALALAGRSRTSLVSFNMSEADVAHIMRRPYTMTSSDGGLVAIGEGKPHPRNYGAFARKLSRYVFEKGIIEFEFAVRSMTSLPARVFRVPNRGVLREGAWADIAIFDPTLIKDTATYTEPHQLAKGMSYVLVNGVVVVDDGEFTSALPGKVLRR